MDEPVTQSVQAACGTQLDRLSGDKVLLAATGATLEREVVVGALRRGLREAADWGETWAMEADDTVAPILQDAAEGFQAADDTLAGGGDPLAGPTLLAHGDPESGLARSGACGVAAPLVLDGLGLQGVSFFVNEADTARADRCRAVRDTLAETRETVTTALESVSEDEADREAVTRGAIAAVEATYARYVETLEEMGLNPKPIC